MFSDDIKAKLKDELDELQNEIMNISSDLPQIRDNTPVCCVTTACCNIIWTLQYKLCIDGGMVWVECHRKFELLNSDS